MIRKETCNARNAFFLFALFAVCWMWKTNEGWFGYRDDAPFGKKTEANDGHPSFKEFGYLLKEDSNMSKRRARYCREMLDIGFNYGSGWSLARNLVNDTIYHALDDSLTRIRDAKAMMKQRIHHYLPFVHTLPKFVDGPLKNLTVNFGRSRLKILRGQLPYIPCRVKFYTPDDVLGCSREMVKERDKSFWVAFFGDSKARERFYFFAHSTHSIFNWTLTDTLNGNRSQKPFLSVSYKSLKKPWRDFEVFSDLGPKLSFIYSRNGSREENFERWIRGDSKTQLPDVLVIEFGAQILMSTKLLPFVAEDKTIDVWWRLRPILKELADKMDVLISAHSRIRTYPRNFNREMKLRYGSKRLRFFNAVDQEVDNMDMITLSSFKNPKLIFWDSMLPFNIASRGECSLIRNSHHSVLMSNESEQLTPIGKFRCLDILHRTRNTLKDEMDTLLNYMCNKVLLPGVPLQSDLCCT